MNVGIGPPSTNFSFRRKFQNRHISNLWSPFWDKWYMDGRLLFSGSETSPSFGGYMERAVQAGKRAAAMIMQNT